MNNDLNQQVKTPCIGVCSTGIGDSVCRGCKRFAHEVIHWNAYSQSEKRIIDQRLELFLAQVVQNKLKLVDRDLLRWQLEVQQLGFQPHKSPYTWAYELLRAGASQIDDLGKYGLQLELAYRDYPLPALRQLIDEEFYILSRAHYERYFELDKSASDEVLESE